MFRHLLYDVAATCNSYDKGGSQKQIAFVGWAQTNVHKLLTAHPRKERLRQSFAANYSEGGQVPTLHNAGKNSNHFNSLCKKTLLLFHQAAILFIDQSSKLTLLKGDLT
jgi:hypothetical protein